MKGIILFLAFLCWGISEARILQDDNTVNTTGFQATNFTYLWRMYHVSSENFTDAVKIVQDSVLVSLQETIVENEADDKIIIESLDSEQSSTGGCVSPYTTQYPKCGIALTSVEVLMEPSDLSNKTIAEYVIKKIINFVPNFNSNATKNQGKVRTEFEYPISIAAKFMVTMSGVGAPMNELETVVFTLVAAETLLPVLTELDFELNDVIVVVQQQGGSSSGRRRRLQQTATAKGYNRVEVLVKAQCGGKEKCNNDNLEDVLVNEGKDALQDDKFKENLIEQKAIIDTIIQAECKGNRGCMEEATKDFVDKAKNSESKGFAVVDEKLEEFVVKEIEKNGGTELPPVERQARIAEAKQEVVTEVQQKKESGQIKSIFTEIDTFTVSDSETGLLPPINLPTHGGPDEGSGLSEEPVSAPKWITIVLIVEMLAIAAAVAFGLVFSPKQRMKREIARKQRGRKEGSDRLQAQEVNTVEGDLEVSNSEDAEEKRKKKVYDVSAEDMSLSSNYSGYHKTAC